MSEQQPPTELSSFFEEEDESLKDTVINQFKTKPFVMAGIIGMVGALGLGYRRYKTQGYLVSPSLFIMQLRVAAQSAVVGCLMCGMIYNTLDKHYLSKKEKKE
ncbi:hypothetical protein QAD02_004042 [Eretmocerus hayati]|uniref:Uncharacterized protein n=1 Tax=Eretmocerus hayati TaxID=131215 RepID=A0ACC2NNV0_9HYME|nr:hypothetical protein QAD02_004042 [Eretmocerus hayati]